MKRAILITLWALLPLTSFGQLSVGLSGGYSYNTLDTDAGYYYNREYVSEGGFSISIPIQYDFNEWFSLRSEVGYLSKSYSWVREVAYYSCSEYENYINRYLQLPVMGHFSFGGDRLRGFFNAGAYVGAWIEGAVQGGLLDSTSEKFVIIERQDYEFNKERDNRFDWGVVSGLGVEYRVFTWLSAFVEGRLYYGLSDTQKSYMRDQYHRYNTTMVAQMGVMYHFNR